MTEPFVDFIPFGGLGEIGLNMMALECGENIVIVDVGLMFPEEGMYGVDVVIPDFTYLLERADRVKGIVLTHGHEDHIGAVPFLLRRLNAPIYGTRLTIELVKEHVKEHRVLADARYQVVAPGETVSIGPFAIEFIEVSHSIVDGVALGIRTPAGIIVHTGDFKIEQAPIRGNRFDIAKFAQYGQEGVMALFSDSTNVERAGYTMSELKIAQTFREIFRSSAGRIVVACFASSLVRIQLVIDVAAEFDRKVAFDGKSMVGNVEIGRDLGHIRLPEHMACTLGELKGAPDNQVTLVTTGSQGEPMSALTRMAHGDHKYVQIKPGDTVVLSSRIIPGNERAISGMINNLYRRGARVIYESVSEVHVSGHAYQEELKMMINLTRPKYFIPVHGEYRHLIKHVELARAVGVPRNNAMLVENGERIRFYADRVERMVRERVGRVFVDGLGVGDVGSMVLRDRRLLAEDGMVIPVIVVDDSTGDILSGPDMVSKGFVFEEDQEWLLEDSKCLILEIFDRLAEEMERPALLEFIESGEMAAEIRTTLRRFFNRVLKRRPLIMPQIILV